jgi:hypothetical protein
LFGGARIATAIGPIRSKPQPALPDLEFCDAADRVRDHALGETAMIIKFVDGLGTIFVEARFKCAIEVGATDDGSLIGVAFNWISGAPSLVGAFGENSSANSDDGVGSGRCS